MKLYKCNEPILMGNDELIKKFKKIKDKLSKSERKYKESKKNANPNAYDKLLLAKLAFGFAKEEEKNLQQELLKRGLLTKIAKST